MTTKQMAAREPHASHVLVFSDDGHETLSRKYGRRMHDALLGAR
jgi:hypothetical protein